MALQAHLVELERKHKILENELHLKRSCTFPQTTRKSSS